MRTGLFVLVVVGKRRLVGAERTLPGVVYFPLSAIVAIKTVWDIA